MRDLKADLELCQRLGRMMGLTVQEYQQKWELAIRQALAEKERVEQLEKKLKSEILRYDAWIEDILSEKYVNCAYCGHRYGKENDSANMEAVRKHVENCSKHPMAKEKARADKMESLVRELVDLISELVWAIEKAEVWDGHPDTWEPIEEIATKAKEVLGDES